MTTFGEPLSLPRHKVGPLTATWRILTALVEHRRQIFSVFWSDFNAPHRKNVLGAAWAYTMPLLPITAYVFVRSVIQDPNADADALHPAVFVVLGVMPWLLMRSAIMTPFEAINRYRTLVMNSTFPLIAAVVAGFGAVSLETLIRLIAGIVVVIALASASPLGVLAATGLLIAMSLFALSLGLFLVPAMVAVPDIRHILDIFFRYAIFFSGVIWSVPIISGSDLLYRLNPLAVFIGAFRDTLVGDTVAYPVVLFALLVATPVLFVFGARTLYATESQIKESLSRQ
ncbi:MAG: ABC transporter permease [Pseudomonadota bacterium]